MSRKDSIGNGLKVTHYSCLFLTSFHSVMSFRQLDPKSQTLSYIIQKGTTQSDTDQGPYS